MANSNMVWYKKLLDWLFIPTDKQNLFIKYILIFYLIMVVILSIDPINVTTNFTVDKVAETSVKSPKNFTYINIEKTNELKEIARQKVKSVYIPVSPAPIPMKAIFERYFNSLKSFHSEYIKLKPEQSPKDLLASYPDVSLLLDNDKLMEFKNFNPGYFDTLKDECEIILHKYYNQDISAENLNEKRNEAFELIKKSPVSNELKSLMFSIIRASISIKNINIKIDEVLTEKKKREAAAAIRPVKHDYVKGSEIISKGSIVSQEQLDTLKMLVENMNKSRYLSAIGYVLIVFVFINLTLIFLRIEKRSLLGDISQYRLMGVLILFALAIIKIIFLIDSNIIDFISILFTPLPSVALLLCMLIDSVIAIFCVFFLGLISIAIAGSSFKFVIVSILGAISGILAWRAMNHGTDVRSMAVEAGVRIGFVNAIGMLAFMLIDLETFDIFNIDQMKDMFLNIGAGFINGLLSGIIANGVMPILEKRFSLATVSKLNELASPTHQLLKKLSEEAPGTYQHSMQVATLAEAAAAAINADPLMTKISAYYHDIGKINRPKYFTENKELLAKDEESPHKRITPYMSSLIIIGHVRDGVEIAHDYNLPEAVISIMSQHHGTTLVEYFYNEAKKLDDNVAEHNFRYRGPKPQTKEAAVLLLADSIEASTRSLSDYSYSSIEDNVEKIIEKKHSEEKQLDESNITLTEIETIKKVFIKTLMSMYHTRIKYPDASKSSKEANDENSNQ